jgi:hypothetical protein
MSRLTGRRLALVTMVALLPLGAVAAVTLALVEHKSPGPGRHASRPGATVFAALRSRPLRKPHLPAKAFCPDPSRGAVGIPAAIPGEHVGLGTGAVHPVSRGIPRFLDFFPPRKGDPLAASLWRSNETMWLSEPRYRGPVLVRGRMVHGSARIGFGADLRPKWELHLPAGAWGKAKGPVHIWGTTVRPPNGWRLRKALTRVRGTADQGESCYFFQVDGVSFSDTILVGVIIQP